MNIHKSEMRSLTWAHKPAPITKGAKLALAILSGLTVAEFSRAVSTREVAGMLRQEKADGRASEEIVRTALKRSLGAKPGPA